MNTNELEDDALDWVVARIEGVSLVDGCLFTKDPSQEQVLYSPSTNEDQAREVIRDNKIRVGRPNTDCDWKATIKDEDFSVEAFGGTPWVAAMRCLVQQEIGSIVDVPEELVSIKSNKRAMHP